MHFEETRKKAGDEKNEFAEKMLNNRKVVFTKTLKHFEWEHTVLAKGDLTEEVNKLKQQNGKDIIAYGRAEFASSLIQTGLVDEYHLLVSPAALPAGKAILDKLPKVAQLKLDKAIAFECGIVLPKYCHYNDI
jgi:dihydrofolate reductase